LNSHAKKKKKKKENQNFEKKKRKEKKEEERKLKDLQPNYTFIDCFLFFLSFFNERYK
jgi:hypothetical protein